MKAGVEAQTLHSHCWQLPVNIYILILCCHLPWYDLMHTWPQEGRLKGETTIFICYVIGQVTSEHFSNKADARNVKSHLYSGEERGLQIV